MVLATVLADTASPSVALKYVWIIVVVAVAMTVARLWVTRRANRTVHPDRRNSQINQRGMEQGGYYTYTPGMFSHSYPPAREGQPEEFRKDNPQPGREPRKPWPEGVLYEQTIYKDEFENLKTSRKAEDH